MKYEIEVSGCDDSTIIVKELTEEQVKFLEEVAEEIAEASTYRCMPRIYITPDLPEDH